MKSMAESVDPASERYAAALAPASLRGVQSFLNTRGVGKPRRPDLLTTAQAANDWLSAVCIPGIPRLRASDLAPLRQLRDTLQAGLEADWDDSGLNDVTGDVRWSMQLTDGELRLTVADGPSWHKLAGALLGQIFVAQQHGQWTRLKACRYSPCSVAFYDGSKNRSRAWHNTSTCGNLVNTRASRARKHDLRDYSSASGSRGRNVTVS